MITCPKCGTAVPDTSVMREIGFAHCANCKDLFALPEAVAAAAPAPAPEVKVAKRPPIPEPPTQTEAQQVDTVTLDGRYEATFHYDATSENLGCGCVGLTAAIVVFGSFAGWCGDVQLGGIVCGGLGAVAVLRELWVIAQWATVKWTVTFTEEALISQRGSSRPVTLPWDKVRGLVHEDERLLGLQHWVYAVDGQGNKTPVLRCHQATAKWFVDAAKRWTGRRFDEVPAAD